METIKQAMIGYRRHLHQIPELEFDLPQTQNYLTEKLTSFGYQVEVVAKSGLVAVKQGEEKEAIAFRADMDALSVYEKTNLPFQSKINGRMHACGHDGHMAIVLGLAQYLATQSLKKSVIFLFQPAEEGPGGAKVIVEEGVLEKYHVEAIFGFHLFPDIEEGKLGLKAGYLMAQSGEIDIIIDGKSSHGAEPHKGMDAIVIASQLIQSIQSIISRQINPLHTALITFGSISGGEARNIIAGSVELKGTIRTLEQETYLLIKEKIETCIKGLSLMHGVQITLDIRDFYPPVINDLELFQTVDAIISPDEKVYPEPYLLAEDFSYYQQVIPGLFMFLGTKNEAKGYTHPLHSAYFNFDEKVLYQGVKYALRICEAMGVFHPSKNN